LHARNPAAIPQQQIVWQQLSSAAAEHLKCHKPFAENLNNNKQLHILT